MSKSPYSRIGSTRQRGATNTPQTQPIPGSTQVANNADGYGWSATNWAMLDRFLILGTVGGTYYVSEDKLTKDGIESVLACIEEDGLRVVNRVVEISDQGRAIKNDPALFVLALCSAAKDVAVRRAALSVLPKVARTGTFLFTFLEFVEGLRGWGPALRRAVGNWYNDKKIPDLAYQLIKYRQRNGWTHRDTLRLSHPIPDGGGEGERTNLYKWVVSGGNPPEWIPLLVGFGKIQQATDPKVAADLIREYRLPREAVPTGLLNSKEVWLALLDDMPMTALIRNLGKLGTVGLLVPGNFDVINKVVAQLSDVERIHKARVHPIQILVALKTYDQGHGDRGSNRWPVVPQVLDALNKAFYTAFKNVEPTGKSFFIGIDVSASMGSPTSGVSTLTCCDGATAMALVVANTEPNYLITRFNHGIQTVPMRPGMPLPDALRYTRNINGGGTDCSLPMLYALKEGIVVDTFVVITDNETWAGSAHASERLNEYRRKVNPKAKLVVMSMVANQFTIADPDDPGMLDIVGWDANVPVALAEFAKL